MPFGKYRGKPLADLPDDYLAWVLDTCQDISPTLRRAIESQLGLTKAKAQPLALTAKVISDWYRRLAREFHPDHGGTHEGMKALNRAHELLRDMVSA